MGELQRQLDEARAALAEKDATLSQLSEERQALSDELNVLKGMGGVVAGAGAGAAAAELAGATRRWRPGSSYLARGQQGCGLDARVLPWSGRCAASAAGLLIQHPLARSAVDASQLLSPPACAALDLSGSDSETMKKVEVRINAVLAEKAALESKLARMEASYKGEIDSLKAVSAVGNSLPAARPVANSLVAETGRSGCSGARGSWTAASCATAWTCHQQRHAP